MSKAAFWAALSAALILGTATPAWAVTYSVTGSQTFQTIEPGHANALCFTVTITSSHILPVTLQSIRFKNLSVGSGATQAQLDQELGSPRLYRDTGSGAFEAVSDSLMKQSSASGGYLLFSAPANASIPALGSITLFVVTNIPTAVRDGENLDLSIEAASDIVLSTALTTTSTFPVSPAGSIAIDGSSAAQYTVVGVGPGNVLAGRNNDLALDVRISANGYQTDRLEKIAVQNEGTATLASDLGTVRAWVDDGNGSLDTAVDRLLGTLSFTGDRWQLTGLTGLQQGRGLDIRPFVSGGEENDRGKLKAGLDVFKSITPGVTASLTVNTDFAETEVDARQINLTRFELFLPEKRTFFLEGAGVFDVAGLGSQNPDLIPFFSRTVGLLKGQEVPILFGLKVSGRQAGLNVGLLDVQTRRTALDEGPLSPPEPARRARQQEPLRAILHRGHRDARESDRRG